MEVVVTYLRNSCVNSLNKTVTSNDNATQRGEPRKRILVTGGAGFLGSHLCEAFLGAGHQVICVDNFSSGLRRNIQQLRHLMTVYFPARHERTNTKERVQIPPYTDRWMVGDRYGHVLSIKANIARVKLDISGKVIKVNINHCTAVNAETVH